MKLTHSYSSIKDFQGCARRYHEVRILKNFRSQDTDATLYGTAVHKAFENYIRDNEPLPETFEHFRVFVEPLSKIEGEILCEHKFGLRRDFTPCGFADDDVWLRGIPDFLALNHSNGVAKVADYKTGKSSRYADPSQLELMACMVMKHFPTINKVKGMLLFVVARDIVKVEVTRERMPEVLSKWAGYAGTIEDAIEHGVFNPSPSGLCRFCPVVTCDHR